MPSFVIEHTCPQCGAPAQLEEAERLFQCGFCRVRSYLCAPDLFRYTLRHRAPAGHQLIYCPYWRFKGMLFSCVPGSIQERFVDASQQAVFSEYFPFSLGFRSQTQVLHFAGAQEGALFLSPSVTRREMLKHLDEQYSARLPKPILHRAHIGECVSLIYAPFYTAGGKLMDGLLNSAVAAFPGEALEPLLEKRQEPGWPILFLSTLCPECGGDLIGDSQAQALTCANCRCAWQPQNGRLQRLEAAYFPGRAPHTLFLPFWRIQADMEGLELHSLSDLIRVANLPKVAQPGWDQLPFYFWSPAFKVRPQNLLTLASHVTTAQPQDGPEPGLPDGSLQPITMPLQEAVESLTLLLAFFARPRRRIESLLPTIRIQARRSLLVYLPFQEGPHEVVHPGLNLAISKNLLAHAKNL